MYLWPFYPPQGTKFGAAVDVCVEMYCKDPDTESTCILNTAAAGTCCGNGMVGISIGYTVCCLLLVSIIHIDNFILLLIPESLQIIRAGKRSALGMLISSRMHFPFSHSRHLSLK